MIGRSSSNQIVLRSERASRRHAAVRWDRGGDDPGWIIEDLNSRNGTIVDGKLIAGPTRLADGDVIEIAGFVISFAHQIVGMADVGGGEKASSQATDDQLTMEIDPSAITDRREHSRYLHEPIQTNESSAGGASLRLLKLAFDLARQGDSIAAMELALDAIAENSAIDTAGGYLFDGPTASLVDVPLVATRQTGSRSYRRPPESLLAIVTADGGPATLARNVVGDGQLATENSRGEIDVESMILAPVRSHDAKLFGWLHVTTTTGATPLAPADLEFVVAASEILAESLLNQTQREQLDKALHRSRRTIAQLQHQLGDRVRLVGRSDAMATVIEQISLAAPTGATVLIRGESGVGKELVAAAMHHASPRRDGPLVCLNCAALSPTLLESELFGHEKGAFTGAAQRRIGRFEQADGGTLFLDEIGEIDATTQVKLLRALSERTIERVGSNTTVKVDVRVIAATNKNLATLVEAGDFREDLYFRLNVVRIEMPPLRQRTDDIVLLTGGFLKEFAEENGRSIKPLTDEALTLLRHHTWPGNVRELRTAIEHGVVMSNDPVIDVRHLPNSLQGGSPTPQPSSDGKITLAGPPEFNLHALETQAIRSALSEAGGNRTRAAELLGISRRTLQRKLKDLGD